MPSAETEQSAAAFARAEEATASLNAMLSLVQALDWLNLRGRENEAAVGAIFAGRLGDPLAIAQGRAAVATECEEGERFAALLEEARALIADERFLNWQAGFPGVWQDWQDEELKGGFDAVIGNPPWDRIKLQQVEWFAARRPEIAQAGRASDRKRMIKALKKAGDPLFAEYASVGARAAASLRAARAGGNYPLLSSGDVNLYSLFVERAMHLVKPDGMVGLLVPSGIASDKMAARFFQGVATTGRLKALYDFENRRTGHEAGPFFPDVDSRFKFCVFAASPSEGTVPVRNGVFFQDVSELQDPERCFPFPAEDFARVNPNTGTAPISRTRRDPGLITAIYRRLPVLIDRSAAGAAVRAWPVRYTRMFDMTNDSHLFRTRSELEEQEGAWPVDNNRWDSPSGQWVPLYEGKMVQAFDHRAAGITVNPANVHRPAQPVRATPEQHRNPKWLPRPQYWGRRQVCNWPDGAGWTFGFKEITAPTNARTVIAALMPAVGFGNKIPVLRPESDRRSEYLLAANLNSIILDYVARQKVQGQTLNLFILEQLPVIPPERYEAARFGPKSAGEIVRESVLELTYTAHDMAGFARDLGHVDAAGAVLPPFPWDDDRRLTLRAKLDALYFHLYGVTDRDAIRYIYSTFPIVERQERRAWNCYISRELCLRWFNALAAGQPDAAIRP